MKPGPKPQVKLASGALKTPNGRIPRGQMLHAEAKRFWRELAPEMIRVGLLTEIDVPAFLLLCEHYAVAIQAARTIAKDGLTRNDENGVARKHPLLQVLRDNSRAFRMYATEFGLVPSSRQRLKFEEPEPDDELTRLFFRTSLTNE